MFIPLYAEDKLLLSEAFYFKLAWIIDMIMTYLLWAPIFILWFLVFFLRVTIFNSFFFAAVKFGLAGPLFCYEAVVVLFILSLVLDGLPTPNVSMTEAILVLVAVSIVLGFSGFIQIVFYQDIKLWESLLRNRTIEEAEAIILDEEEKEIP